MVDGQLQVPLDDPARRKPAVGLVVDDLVPAARQPVHAVDDPRERHALHLDPEAELEGRRDPVVARVVDVIAAQDLPGVLAVGGLLGLVSIAVPHPLLVEDRQQLAEGRGHRDRPVVEPVERSMDRVAEGERGGGGGREPLLVLEPVLRRAGLVGLEAAVGQSHAASP